MQSPQTFIFRIISMLKNSFFPIFLHNELKKKIQLRLNFNKFSPIKVKLSKPLYDMN